MNKNEEHKPVLLEEIGEYLVTEKNGIYVDCTLGLGGHTAHLMKLLGKKSRIVAIDRDSESLDIARKRLAEYEDRIDFVHSEYSNLRGILKNLGIEKVNGVLLDLGFSSLHVERPERGFSFSKEGPLDMRYDRTKGITAKEYLETTDYKELSDTIFKYGNERLSRKIARAIINYRDKKQIETTLELADIINKAAGRFYRKSRINAATRTFQALRIAVNDEIKHLEVVMNEIAESLISKGRLAIISFHSIEDKKVKEFIFNNSCGCTCSPYMPKCVCGHSKKLNVIAPKVIKPKAKEFAVNPRARSARLRVAEKV